MRHAAGTAAPGAPRRDGRGRRSATSPSRSWAAARSGEVWRARDSQTGADRRLQAGRPGVAADAGDARTGAARAEAAAARAEPAPRARARLRQGRRRTAVHRLRAGRGAAAGPAGRDARARSPLDRAKAIVAQIGEALLEGQKVGVVHHDLVAQERARLRQRRGQGHQLRGAGRRIRDGVRRARVPVAGAGRGQAGRPAVEHLQPGRRS